MNARTLLSRATSPRGLEAVAHAGSWVAVSLTVLMVGTGQVAESNPVARTLIDTLGLRGFALLTPLLISVLYRLLHRFADRHWHYALPAGVLVADALGNVAVVATHGLPETVLWTTLATACGGSAALATVLFVRPTTVDIQAAMRPPAPRPAVKVGAIAAVIVLASAAPPMFGVASPVGSAEADAADWTEESEKSISSADMQFMEQRGDYLYLQATSQSGPSSGEFFIKYDTSSETVVYNKTISSNGITDMEIFNGNIYFSEHTDTSTGTVYSYDADGSLRWSDTVPEAGRATGLGSGDGSVFVSGYDNDGASTDDHSGYVVRYSESGSPTTVYSSSTGAVYEVEINGDNAYISRYGEGVVKLDRTNSWSETAQTGSPSSSQYYIQFHIHDGAVAARAYTDGSGAYETHKYDLSTLSLQWEFNSLTRSDLSNMYVDGGTLYGNANNEFVGVNYTDGSLVSNYSNNNDIRSVAQSDPGTVYFGTAVGTIGKLSGLATDGTNTVSGYVTTTDGRPVANATTQITGVDFASLSGAIEEQRDRATELQQLANDPAPSGWDNQLPAEDLLTGSRASGKYVAVHTPQDWEVGDPRYVAGTIPYTDPQLGFSSDGGPYTYNAPAGETLMLTIWDGTDQGLVQNAADEDLPGATTTGTVVVEQLGPGGGDNVLDKNTYETDEALEGQFISKTHQYASVTLSPGFYRVYPESSPDAAYIVSVGNPKEIVRGWESNLRTEAGQLTSQAETLSNLEQNGTFQVIRVSTNQNGYYSTSTSATVNETAVIAYKKPAGVTTDPANLTRADVRSWYESQNLSDALTADSVYIATAPERVSPPANNTNITVRELSADPFLSLNRSANRTAAIKEFLKDKLGWSGLSGLDKRLIENMPVSELEDYYGTKINLTEDSTVLREEAEEHLPGNESVDWDQSPNELSPDELRERLSALEQAMEEQQDVINSSSSVGEAANGTVNVAFEFARELAADDIAVYAEYANGTTKLVDPEHYTVEQGGLIGGGTQIQVTDYPVDDTDPAAVTFRTEVLDNGDSGSERVTVRNPSFTGQIPDLNAVSLSSLAPGPNEDVTLSVDGGTNYQSLEAVDVTDPNGDPVTTTLSNGEASFQTSGKGVYTAAITFSNPGGQNFTERVDIEAIAADLDQPATIRAQQGIGGPYALTGDDLVGGDLQTRLNNGQITALGRVGANDDPPTTVHTHVETIDTPRTGAVTVRVTRAPDDTVVRQRTTTVVHLKDLGDDYHVYRVVNGEIQPIAPDGNQYGSISTTNGTTVSTYSGSDGEVTVRYVANPTLIEDVQWRWQNIQESIPNLPFTAAPALGPAATATGGLIA